MHKYGGLYFDTDVEVIKPMNDLFDDEAFIGRETADYVAPGLVIWAKTPGNRIFEEMLETYSNTDFIKADGSLNTLTVCVYFTEILKKNGFIKGNQIQKCGGFTVYPIDYFCPFNDLTGQLRITENTYTIHWYQKTWMSKNQILKNKITRVLHRIFGIHFFLNVKNVMKR